MINHIIHRLLLRRHFWRQATFSEIAELYASRMLRMLAINMSAVFIAIFLYQIGYDILFIAGYWACYYLFKAIVALFAAKYAAVFGPKHGILLANLLYIPSMLIFTMVPEWGLPALVVAAAFQALSATVYDLCHLIDFSKVKSVDHAGKEIAYMNIVEKVATRLSPLIGGMLAFVAGPRATMVAAAVLFALASIPLFKTAEPIPARQRLVFRGFPWRLAWRGFIAESAIGFDAIASGSVWSLFIVIVILGVEGGNAVYAQLGALLSVVLFVAFAASYAYGRLIDRKRGGDLLRVMVIINSLTHLARPFATTPAAAVGINASNEAATTGYAMAFMRGMFDTADISGHRVTYLGLMEIAVNIGGTLVGLGVLLFVSLFGEVEGLKLFFFAAAPITLLIMTPKFRLYQK
jgi:MFS family permease